jgi:cytidine deaminase
MQGMLRPELVFGLVGPVGSDLTRVSEQLALSLESQGYRSHTIHLIELVHELDKWRNLEEAPLDRRIETHMDAGNGLRRTLERGDALAMLGIGAVVRTRVNLTADRSRPAEGNAYILRSLKHPHEVDTLRQVYGPSFLLIGVHCPREARIAHLASEIAKSHHEISSGGYREVAERLNQRDEAEVEEPFGQDVRRTFPAADVFIDGSVPDSSQRSVDRFTDLLFGHPFHTLARDEFAMFHAQAAALRSSALGRQVGAVIASEEGDIIAVGTNEVPKAGGGLYWCHDEPDWRDFTLGFDTNDRMKLTIIGDILERLARARWLNEDLGTSDVDELVRRAVSGERPVLPEGAQVMNLTEFGRSVHAEMAALSDAARRGVSVRRASLYTTTFPCHNCAKHIVAAGIDRVVYIEPYPKSLASDLHLDSIAVERPNREGQVVFQPFVGISPSRCMDLFTAPKRKDAQGSVIHWKRGSQGPRYAADFHWYQVNETKKLDEFSKEMQEKGISAVD